MLRGRVAKAEIDDLNSDGYPDLVLYVYTDSSAIFGTVYAFVSKQNKSFIGCILPDPMMDGKINEGYKGHDQFSLMEGYLLDKFPIYKTGDDKDKPSGGTRVILYQLVPDEGEVQVSEDADLRYTLIQIMRTITLEEHFASPAFMEGPGRPIREQARMAGALMQEITGAVMRPG